MAYTSHGHHIPGTTVTSPSPVSLFCGGVVSCFLCCRETANEKRLKEMSVVVSEPSDNQTKALELVGVCISRRYSEVRDTPPKYTMSVVSYEILKGNWRAVIRTDLRDRIHYEVSFEHADNTTTVSTYVRLDVAHFT